MTGQNDDVRPRPMAPRAERVAKLNDRLRKGEGEGRVFITEGVIALGMGALLDIMTLVNDFDCFTPDNDPHGEHDFGSFHYRGERLLWKIDYYDRSMMHGSDDPSDPSITCRVLTVMLAREY
ncbi:DUF3768 domain-containing protein [Alteriqipengyuania sp.]|uniref:DUF3768 domain-containing protein n=1 Tax=Alteriqipengyuania sp. TaxID=2800692 RepID=UPI0035117732